MADVIKPVPGFLYCERCGFSIDYRGFPEPSEKFPWPRHRCGRDINDFTVFLDKDPHPMPPIPDNLPPIPKKGWL